MQAKDKDKRNERLTWYMRVDSVTILIDFSWSVTCLSCGIKILLTSELFSRDFADGRRGSSSHFEFERAWFIVPEWCGIDESGLVAQYSWEGGALSEWLKYTQPVVECCRQSRPAPTTFDNYPASATDLPVGLYRSTAGLVDATGSRVLYEMDILSSIDPVTTFYLGIWQATWSALILDCYWTWTWQYTVIPFHSSLLKVCGSSAVGLYTICLRQTPM